MTRIDSYRDALDWLFQRNQFAIKLGLENPRHLLERLGNPDRDGVYLHVAGTNGKGSVCANLAAMLPVLGFERIGLYTSPHLVSFRERIRVNGIPVSPDWVTSWLNNSLPILEELNTTYFECVTAMAFAYFKDQNCDAVVLETGLGGRLDATNIVVPKVTAITSISLDHTAILGNTLEEIWGEKLGIVKADVPMIIDENRPSLAQLAKEKTEAMNAPLINLADRVETVSDGFQLRGQFAEYFLPSDLRPEPHQIRNAALSLLTLESFHGEALPSFEKLISVLRATRFAGRTQWLESAEPGLLPVLLDGAHNPAGVEALCRHLKNSAKGRARIFFAVMRDKNITSLYRELHSLSKDIVYLDLSAAFPRALVASELKESLNVEETEGLREAYLSWDSLKPLLQNESGADDEADYAVVCGSLYLLGEIIPTLLHHYRGLEEFGKMLEEEK